VSKEEALQYLKLQGINEEQAAQIYGLVGGRMIRLKSIADDIKENRTLEGMCTACNAMQKTGLVSHHLYRYTPGDVLRTQKPTQGR
jgi:hypothetical protein